MLKTIITANLLWLSFSALAADSDQVPYQGTWSGTIGNSKIQVCFNGKYDSAYYYLKHKAGIRLTQEEDTQDPNEWREQVINKEDRSDVLTGIWKFTSVAQDSLVGNWLNPDTQQTLDIKLQRVSGAKDGCDDAFYAPLMPEKFRYSSGKLQNKAFKTIKTDTGTAFEVPKNVKNADKLNAFIQSWIKEQYVNGFDCKLNGGEPWDKTLEPVFWTDRWLVIRDALPDTYCGGAHSSAALEYHVFDLDSGEQVNVWSWLIDGENSAASGQEEGKKTKLRQLLEERNPRDDCEELKNDFWLGQPYPTRKALVFITEYAHVARACEDEIGIDFKTIEPFLTPLGKEAVKSIMQAK